MNFRVLGTIISILIITALIVIMVKDNIKNESESAQFEEYPSGLVEDQNEINEKGHLLSKNDVAPDFELKNLSGELMRLSDYKGKKVLLNFWASWCPPCKQEMPYLQKYYEKSKDKSNVEILTVNMIGYERGGIETVEKFVESYDLTFPVLLDESETVMNLYSVQAFPTTYIINEKGIITDVVIRPLDDNMIEELIENAN